MRDRIARYILFSYLDVYCFYSPISISIVAVPKKGSTVFPSLFFLPNLRASGVGRRETRRWKFYAFVNFFSFLSATSIMVCKTCEAKLSKVAASDPYRNRNAQGTLVASGSKIKSPSGGVGKASEGSSSLGGRKVGENKLLGAKNRYNPLGMTKCTICKGTVQQDRSKYCQGCSFKRGVCSMCGKPILDANVKKMSKMSS